MRYTFKEMTRDTAVIISQWEYPAPYHFYNMDSDEEGLAELMNGDYFGVTDEAGHIAGFFCFGLSARVPGGYAAGFYMDEQRLDIGLGMDPALTGQGLGSEFLQAGLQWLQQQHGRSRFRLVVASFNERARRVYAKNGFEPRGLVLSRVHGEDVEFLCMEADLS
ncbi:N-acetyltransferase [Paenibacillus sp. 79R4]|uniref:GNAT family N-acetyltransferase n=1 Tax=Paenibacillus sp. 79R4 TaxID=2212847 RepID=UPI0015BD6A62|nr:GNAT family N-acetyltransferase [Paenibacillus sp. 79R4]NWL87907.1 N-acetyltransferase [Paenibacillus sp. 79R4]